MPKPDKRPPPKPKPPAPVATAYPMISHPRCAAFPILIFNTGLPRDQVVAQIAAAGLVGAFYGSGKSQGMVLAEAEPDCPDATCQHFEVTENIKGHVKLRILCDNKQVHNLRVKILKAALAGDREAVGEYVRALRIAKRNADYLGS